MNGAADSFDEQELGVGSRMTPPNTEWEQLDTTDAAPHERPASNLGVAEQIRELEARLDGLIRGAQEEPPPPSFREQVGSAAQKMAAKLSVPVERPGSDDGNVGDAVRELMSSDYYLRQWGRLGMRSRSEEVDDFGLDPSYEARLLPLLDFLYQRYFRVEAAGLEHIPATGRCLVVANHSGTLPLDGVMLRTMLRLAPAAQRELRWLAEDFIYYLPFLGAFMNRIGAVRACQENAERLLSKGSLVAVFPEGVKGIGKLYRERYKLQRFGRGGFIRLALRTQTPLVPCAIIGAEEASPLLYRIDSLSKLIGLPYVPVTPTFPALGPLGLLPAPTKWQIVVGEPLSLEGYGPEAADDHVLVGRLSERVRATIQRMLDTGIAQRQSVWLG
ncbi:MAG: acyltransferase family protein [Myxococcales bacterium]|nr:acyltransferase family protein [Myxococcales bacterium]